MSKDITAWSGRAYTWSLSTYAEYTAIERLLNEAKHWAWCKHDKDIEIGEDGEQKLVEPHTHIIVTFEKWISLEAIKGIMASDQNTFGECRRKCGNAWVNLNIGGLYRYLIHQDDLDKYQYDPSERHNDGTDFWNRYDDFAPRTDKNEEFLTDLLGAYRTEAELDQFMARKYGKDYIKNARLYKEFRFFNISNELYIEQHNRYDELINFVIKEKLEQELAIQYLKDRISFERGFYAK